jgi:hypothetical protein
MARQSNGVGQSTINSEPSTSPSVSCAIPVAISTNPLARRNRADRRTPCHSPASSPVQSLLRNRRRMHRPKHLENLHDHQYLSLSKMLPHETVLDGRRHTTSPRLRLECLLNVKPTVK